MKENYMNTVTVRVYGELNDFLPPPTRKKRVPHLFFGKPTVKDFIESLGIPHTEVDLILLDEQSVGFEAHLQDGDRLTVYPRLASIDIQPLQHLQPEPLKTPRFITDVHLGKLARYLRMLGFDTLYDPTLEDAQIIERGVAESRMILTRDLGILKNSRVRHGYFVRAQIPIQQAREIALRFDLKEQLAPFSRCLECNTQLEPVRKEAVAEQVPPKVFELFSTFFRCPGCQKIYWEGSHHAHMSNFIRDLTKPDHLL